jgi:transglutaminase-like putative cysteine protease
MRYDIAMTIGYRYGVASDRVRTLVRLLPSDVPGQQRVEARALRVDPAPDERRDDTDFFGNTITALGFHRPVDQVTYRLTARIARDGPEARLNMAPGLAALAGEIASVQDLGPSAPHHYRAASPRIPPVPEIEAFARSLLRPGATVSEIVTAVGQALHDEMRFDAQATTVDTPAAEAFANRHGVCQDFSHIMITALRALGIPARYVSGFVRTTPPEGQARLEGADAMHAWVSAWCGAETGWIEYDPTNACPVRLDHIVLGYGRDYGDISPVKGVLRTSGTQWSSQAVDVVPL